MKNDMNYQDIRVQKTERRIRKAFHELMQEKNIGKITVLELSQRAEINKTTFYAHYETIQDLIDTLEEETISYIINNLDRLSLLIADPDLFIDNLYHSLQDCGIGTILHINQSRYDFTQKLNSMIRDEINRRNIHAQDHQQISVLIRFILNGIIGLLQNPSQTIEEDLVIIKDFIKSGLKQVNRL